MLQNFQRLVNQILENTAAPGGVFGPNNAYSAENIDKLDTRATMSVVGSGSKKKKKKKMPLMRRTLPNKTL
jgi:hypothetical protein